MTQQLSALMALAFLVLTAARPSYLIATPAGDAAEDEWVIVDAPLSRPLPTARPPLEDLPTAAAAAESLSSSGASSRASSPFSTEEGSAPPALKDELQKPITGGSPSSSGASSAAQSPRQDPLPPTRPRFTAEERRELNILLEAYDAKQKRIAAIVAQMEALLTPPSVPS